MALPTSWTEALDRLGKLLGGVYRLDGVSGDPGAVEGEAWVREAVRAAYGVESLRDLDREARAVAFQKVCGVVLLGEEEGIPLELVNASREVEGVIYGDGTIVVGEEPGRRLRVARLFARYFGGAALEGPPWRLSAVEDDRPTYTDWAEGADFA